MGSLLAQDKWSFVYDYDQFHMWEEIYLTPVYNGNVLYSAGDIHLANGEVVYDDCGNRADKRVYRKLGTPLSDSWSLDFDFTPTAGGPQGVAHILAGLTAGTENPYNIVPETVSSQYPSFSHTDQDGIFFEYLSPLNGATSTYYLRLRAKDGTTYQGPSSSILLAPNGQTSYLRMDRSGASVNIRVFSDAARSNQTAIASITLSGSITGLNVLQHSNIPQGGYDRKLTATIDNFKLFDASIPCVRCGEISLAPSSAQNYVLQKTARVPVATEGAFNDLSEVDDIWTEVVYFDGLGRPIQEISVAAAPNSEGDFISYHSFDELGREVKVDLPFIASSANGSFRDGGSGGVPSTDQQSFYNTAFPHIPVYDRNTPFIETQFEASPLNRIIEQGAPGRDWQLEVYTPGVQSANEHSAVFSYGSNLGSEQAFRKGDGPGATPHTYSAASLFVLKSKDSNGNEAETFLDKLGNTLFVKIQSGNNDWAYTHYVYDIFGRIKYIIQPEGWEIAKTSGLNSTVLEEYTFQYIYDARGRVIEKKVPGADWEYMVYNRLDQLVFSQDGNHRADGQKWDFFKYDNLGRPIMTGIYYTFGSETRSSLQNTLNSTSELYEGRDGSNYLLKGYTNNAIPDILGYVELNSVSHYDDYDINLDGYPGEGAYYDPISKFPTLEASSRNQNKITSVEIRILNPDSDMPDWKQTSTFYDNYGREIQIVSENHLGGLDESWYEHNFSGELVSNLEIHNQNYQVYRAFTYGPRARRLRSEHKIESLQNSNVNSEFHTLTELEFNQLGQVKRKKIHYKSNENFLQIGDYEYNIRGWLMNYNMPSSQPIIGSSADNDLFAMGIIYNDPGWLQTVTETRYNGDIAYLAWQTPSVGSDEIRTYDMQYDGLNRIKNANYVEFQYINNNPTPIWTTLGRYNISGLTYDKNGNIESLIRMGKSNTNTYGVMDDLSFSYSNGNQLLSISDAGAQGIITDVEHFVDGNQGNDFAYDQNGNLGQDLNKGILSIDYNYLNKPIEVLYNSGAKMQYVYDAAGTKLRQKVFANGGINETRIVDYTGIFQYEDTDGSGANPKELLFVMNAEGRTRISSNEIIYESILRDHLGNSRVVFSDLNNDGAIDPNPINGEVLQIDHYYPFGMKLSLDIGSTISTSPPHNYLFNGKEFQTDLDLDWYDYGARMYDPSTGKWNSVDPLGEAYGNWSPYNYTLGNPLRYIDPDGRSVAGTGLGASSARGRKDKEKIEYPGYNKDWREEMNKALLPPSTHVDKNGKIIWVYNDGDNSIYQHDDIILEQGGNEQHNAKVRLDLKRGGLGVKSGGGRRVGRTIFWFDFMIPNDVTGGFYGPAIGSKFDNPLPSWIQEEYNIFDGETLINNLSSGVRKKLGGEGLYTVSPHIRAMWLATESRNRGPLDIKVPLGFFNGYNYSQGVYTSGRVLGNILFGKNMAVLTPYGYSAEKWFGLMKTVGGFNQIRNKGDRNHYLPGSFEYPFYGEHLLSGSAIYFGYWGKFYKK